MHFGLFSDQRDSKANAHKNQANSPIISLNLTVLSSWNITFWWQRLSLPSISFCGKSYPPLPRIVTSPSQHPWPVAKAMSCKIAVFRAPKAGALMATTSKIPRCLLRTKVCKAWRQTHSGVELLWEGSSIYQLSFWIWMGSFPSVEQKRCFSFQKTQKKTCQKRIKK